MKRGRPRSSDNTAPTVNLFMPLALRQRLAPYRDRINLSALFQEALTKRLDQLEDGERRYERNREWLEEN